MKGRGLQWVFIVWFATPVEVKLFTITENHDSNPFYLGIHQQRVDGDVLVSYGAISDIQQLQFFFNYRDLKTESSWIKNEPIISASETQKNFLNSGEQNCKDLLAPGTVFYRPFVFENYLLGQQKLLTNVYREVPLVPLNILQPHNLAAIRSCCNPSTCIEKCFAVTERKKTQFFIVDTTREKVVFKGVCTYCALRSCTTTCPHGTYSSGYSSIDQVPIQSEMGRDRVRLGQELDYY